MKYFGRKGYKKHFYVSVCAIFKHIFKHNNNICKKDSKKKRIQRKNRQNVAVNLYEGIIYLVGLVLLWDQL